MTLSSLLKSLLPAAVVGHLQQVRLRTLRGYLRYGCERRSFRRKFEDANPALHVPSVAEDLLVQMPHVGKLRLRCEAIDAVEHFGWKEPSMVRELRKFAELISGKKCFVDIGANYGIFSALFLLQNPEGIALAVDPDPRAIELLEKHAALNSVDERLHVKQCALGRASGEILMRESGPHYVAGPAVGESGDIPVEMTTLNGLAAEFGLQPGCMKIDVEGFELEVIAGGRETLEKFRPLLFLEVHPTSEGKMEAELFRLLIGMGYRITDEADRVVDDPLKCACEYRGGAYRVIASFP
jgi:FkbM family methyltransferase